MRIVMAQHLDPSLRKGFENRFNRDLRDEIVDMTTLSIKLLSKHYDDIHLYLDRDSFKVFENLPVTIHELKTKPNFFCAAKLEVLKDQKDHNFLWVDPDIFISKPFTLNHKFPLMVDKDTTLNDFYYDRNKYMLNEINFIKEDDEYHMVRSWLNSGLLWFRDESIFKEHIKLYEELLTYSYNAIIVETWNISYLGDKYGYGTFQWMGDEYIHLDGYKKFFGISKDLIKNLNSTI